jgi:CBS domain-containing protein
MTLEKYRCRRLVVLSPGSSAYEVARAMVDNHVGAVLLADRTGPVGVVTDRDLMKEIGATGFDSRVVPACDVMTASPQTLEIDATIDDVLQVMEDNAVRRVPLTEHGRLVGIVTFDDLVLDGAIDADQAATIVRTQLEMGAKAKPPGAVRPDVGRRTRPARAFVRRAARADATYTRLLRLVKDATLLPQDHAASLALEVVLGCICRRIRPDEAKHLIAQLPSKLQPVLLQHVGTIDKSIDRETIEGEICRVLMVDRDQATAILNGVASAVAQVVTAGEIFAVADQLPAPMKSLFQPRQA